MGTTKRSDLIVPEILQEAIQAEFAGIKALWGTDAAIVNSSLPTQNAAGGKIRGGDTIKIPYFSALGEMDDIDTEGDALTPASMAMSSETATVKHSGKAVEITNWAQMAAMFADPYAEMARQFKELVVRRGDKALLAAATASLPSTNIKDVYSASTPRILDWDLMVDAKQLWGDEQEDIVLLTVHSKIYGDLQKLKDANGQPLLVDKNDGTLPRFNGVPVKVSDRNTKSSDSPAKYESLILKKGALAFWFNEAPRVLTDSDILADTEVAAIHLYWVAHRYQRTPGATLPGVIKIVSN